MTETPATGRARLTALLDRLGIAVETIEHPPVHTVEEALPYWSKLPGQHTKNLFLKDAKGELWLICLPQDRRADLKSFAAQLGAKKFSFASPALLDEVLGVEQGGVSPLALVNDTGRRVRLALDATLLQAPVLAFHPLENTATIAIGTVDFERLLAALGVGVARLAPEAEDIPGAS